MKQQILILTTAVLFAVGTTVFAANGNNTSKQDELQNQLQDTTKVNNKGNMMMHNHKKMQMPEKETPKAEMKKCNMNKKSDNNAMVSYQCPMKCEGDKTYDTPGKCPKCGMDMKMTDKSMMQMHQNDSLKTQKMKHDGMNHQMMNENASLAYQCTMKCEADKAYNEPGNCPKCNMQLKALTPKTNILKDDQLEEKLFYSPLQ